MQTGVESCYHSQKGQNKASVKVAIGGGDFCAQIALLLGRVVPATSRSFGKNHLNISPPNISPRALHYSLKSPRKSSEPPNVKKLPQALQDQEKSCWGRVDLVLQIFFLKFKNNFESGFSRVKVGDSALPPEKSPTLALEKFASKLFSNFRKKIYKTKSTLPNNFPLGPGGLWEVFQKNRLIKARFLRLLFCPIENAPKISDLGPAINFPPRKHP